MWESKTIHRRYACDLETPDVDKTELQGQVLAKSSQKLVDL
jgi:hypothetical protein